jgi:hypothetical protein
MSLLIVLVIIGVGWWLLKKVLKVGVLIAIAAALLLAWYWFAVAA